MPLDVICFALKLLGTLCIMAGCCGMGYFMCRGLSDRVQALSELRVLAMRMSGEIRCMAEPMPAMLSHTAENAGPVYRSFFAGVSSQLCQSGGRTLAAVWSESVDRHLSSGPLKDSDLRLIKKLGETLGSHDSKMQLACFQLFIDELQTTIDMLNSEMRSQKRVYGGLWILGGVFIVILFI